MTDTIAPPPSSPARCRSSTGTSTSAIPPLPMPCWTGLCTVHTASNSKEKACENCAPPKPGLTKRPFSSPNSSACDPHRYPAGIIGMPGWLRSEQRAGFDRNRWLQSSECAIDLEAGHFRHAQASAIGGTEYGLVFDARCRLEQLADFLDTQHRRQFARKAGQDQAARQVG